MSAFLPHLKTFYDKFPYTLINNNERHYQAVMYTIFAMLGADVSSELPTSDGRIDLVLKTVDCIFIFELKYGKDAVTAINQIEEKSIFLLLQMISAKSSLWVLISQMIVELLMIGL